MTQEQLRMQMLAGIITEGEYKAKLEEIEVRAKIGKSYPAPGYTSDEDEDEGKEIILTPQQQKDWENAMIKDFYETMDEDGEEAAVYNLPSASERILSNILTGRKPNEHWDDGNEWENTLKNKGIDWNDYEWEAEKMLDKFSKESTNNPKIKDIQSWIRTISD